LVLSFLVKKQLLLFAAFLAKPFYELAFDRALSKGPFGLGVKV
jgi:hypothetical protein